MGRAKRNLIAPAPPRSLEGCIDYLLRSKSRASNRLLALADYVIYLIKRNGLDDDGVKGGTSGELTVPGLARKKDWDVAFDFAGKYRLLVSLKSMLKNISGAVPNRLDDLQGEVANIQQLRPEVVIGYVVLFDVAKDSVRREDSRPWSDFFEGAIENISIRTSPLWNQGLLEGVWFIRFDSRRPIGRRLLSPRTAAKQRHIFIQSLLWELHQREPAVPFKKVPQPPAAKRPRIPPPAR